MQKSDQLKMLINCKTEAYLLTMYCRPVSHMMIGNLQVVFVQIYMTSVYYSQCPSYRGVPKRYLGQSGISSFLIFTLI